MAYNSAYTGPQVDAGIAKANSAVQPDGSVPMTGALDMGGQRVTNVGAPTEGTDAATKGYTDTALAGKQDKVTGSQDKIAGFNAEGNLTPVDPPDTGVTSFNGRSGAVTPSENDYSAGMIKFADGETFQQKYDAGELTGPQGGQGPKGDPGDPGAQGPAGADGAPGAAATINGVNALTLNATGGLSGSQSGSTYTLSGNGLKPVLRTATLTTSGWSSNTQTVTVSGVVADTNAQLIYVSPANKDSATAWGGAGVFCSAQGANSLTFVCDSVPSANISVNISIQEAQT